ncbi:hypothetical protein Ancab_028788, partial [Ancistrocladus abbreviatus]
MSSERKKEGGGGNTKSMVPAMNGGEQVQINGEARNVAESDRISVPMESDGADRGKGLEERVERVKLMNSISSLHGRATTCGKSKPAPYCLETGSFDETRAKVSETEDLSLGRGGEGGCSVGPKVVGIKEVGSDEGSGGPSFMSRVGWAGLGFDNPLLQSTEAMEKSKKSKAKETQDAPEAQIEGSGGNHQPSVVVQKCEITIS